MCRRDKPAAAADGAEESLHTSSALRRYVTLAEAPGAGITAGPVSTRANLLPPNRPRAHARVSAARSCERDGETERKRGCCNRREGW